LKVVVPVEELLLQVVVCVADEVEDVVD